MVQVMCKQTKLNKIVIYNIISQRPKERGITFFYGKIATHSWDMDRSRWAWGYHFLNYTKKMGIDLVINSNMDTTRALNKQQGYLPRNYKFKLSQVWDHVRSGNEVALK